MSNEDLIRRAENGDVEAAKLLPMSEWGEAARHIMTPLTIACNHRLHMYDVQADKEARRKRLAEENKRDWLDDSDNFPDGAFVTLSTPDMYTDFTLTGEQLQAVFTALAEME